MSGLRFSIPVARRRLGSTGEIQGLLSCCAACLSLCVCIHLSVQGRDPTLGAALCRAAAARTPAQQQPTTAHVSAVFENQSGEVDTERDCTVGAALRRRFITFYKSR